MCADVEFSPEDATRTDVPFLCQVVEAVIAAGATTVNIPDTVGYTMPEEYGRLIRTLREEVAGIDKVTISTHCHNDLGLAVANSLAGVQAGARQVECTINGIGERAGNASLEEIVMAMRVRPDRYPYQTAVASEQLYASSQMLAEITRVPVQPNKAIIGRNAFAHEAGIHQDGMLKNPLTYEIMTPQSVGVPDSRLVLGKHSGRHALALRCEQLGHQFERRELDEIYRKFVVLADRIKKVQDSHLLELIQDVSSGAASPGDVPARTRSFRPQWSLCLFRAPSPLSPEPTPISIPILTTRIRLRYRAAPVRHRPGQALPRLPTGSVGRRSPSPIITASKKTIFGVCKNPTAVEAGKPRLYRRAKGGSYRFVTAAEAGLPRRRLLIYILSKRIEDSMQLRVTSLPGDGIGPEVISQAICVLEEVATGFGHDLELDEKEIGGVALEKFGNPLPDSTIQACLASQAVLLGAVGSPAFDHNPRELRPEAGLLRLRQELGAFANLRPAVFYPSLAACSPLREEIVKGTDILIVRELLGGLYFGQPRSIDTENDGEPGARQAVNTMRYSEPEIERIARVAFQLARTRRRRLLSVDKSNVLECSRLWREVVTRIARDFPDVQLSHMYVDSAAMSLVLKPAGVRRHPHRKHVRRHSVRSGGRNRGIARPACLGQHRRPGRPLRTGSRIGSRHRGPERRQSARRDPLGGPDAAPYFSFAQGSGVRGGRRHLHLEGRLPHPRSGAPRRAHRLHRRNGSADRRIRAPGRRRE